MNLPLNRGQALELLKKDNPSEANLNHYLESEAIMRGLAEHFGEDIEYWGMLGLLHDIDWERTQNNVEEHGTQSADILAEAGFDENFIHILQSHVYGYDKIPKFADKKRSEKIEHCLAAAETLTGIIYAYALMRGKKISDMKAKGLKKKFKDKTFASNCNRDVIREIEKAGLELSEFFQISIESIKKIKDEIGLE